MLIKRRLKVTGRKLFMIRKSVFALLCAYFAIFASATFGNDLVQISATASHKYSSWRKNEVREAAILKAKVVALEKYVATLPAAKQRMLRAEKDSLVASIDSYLAETIVQQEKRDKSSNMYKVAIVTKVNPIAFDVFLTENSPAGASGSGFGSDFGAMFVARVESSRKSYDDKRVSISETDSMASIDDTSASSESGSFDSSRERSFSVTTTGGSTERKRDKTAYEPSIEISEEVAFAVEEYLVNAGFEPMNVDQLDGVPYMDEVVDDMRASARMPSRMQKMFQVAAMDAGWTFLGLGTIDIGVPENDRARGTVRVPATVSFRVWSLDTGRARTVASVRPQVVYGQDRGSSSVAETNAYNAAVRHAMDTVIAQLQQKGLY